ncbi:MAG: molybdenum cofactor biosynthesis protein MoaE [Candidatus Odinarchaeota archaeon]|nr:molybdenum cofactor biosynthesis protein MoaE [Candidatus Odinarchaeota archaeon]
MRKGEIHNKGEISLQEIIDEIKRSPRINEVGAIACFIGIVRGKGKDGSRVKKLEFEAYEEEANKVLSKICEETIEKNGVIDAHIHHNVGTLNVGEDIVYVVVAGEHREETFQALREAVERFKKEAPIWKKEHTEKGSYWVTNI